MSSCGQFAFFYSDRFFSASGSVPSKSQNLNAITMLPTVLVCDRMLILVVSRSGAGLLSGLKPKALDVSILLLVPCVQRFELVSEAVLQRQRFWMINILQLISGYLREQFRLSAPKTVPPTILVCDRMPILAVSSALN